MQTMKRMARWLLPGVAAVLLAAPLGAQDAPSSTAFDPAQEEAIRQLVRDYLLEHPEVLIEAVQSYRTQQQRLQDEKIRQSLVDNRDQLFYHPDDPVVGALDGDVVVVEFFDYRCPYCIQVAQALRQAVAEDGNVRLVMKEFPILGPESLSVARLALAAAKQGRYDEYHFALMAVTGKVDTDKALKLAEKMGLDVDQLRRDMQSAEIDEMLQRNYALAQDLQINGTPAFVVGDEVVRGAIDMATLRALIAGVRARSS